MVNQTIHNERRRTGIWAKLKQRFSRRVRKRASEWFDGLEWSSADGVKQRVYGSYEDYCKHQALKFSRIQFPESDEEQRALWRERFRGLDIFKRGDTVLCLGARLGTECKAFIDLGCVAVGIDLEPGPKNRHVVHGDFHNLEFSDHSIDYVFTNALDHSFDLNRILDEVNRVLKPGGLFIAEIAQGSKDQQAINHGRFESMWWERLDTVVDLICQHHFEVQRRNAFNDPWAGEQIVFRTSRAASRKVA